MQTIEQKIKDLFAEPSEIELLQHKIDMTEWERDVYRDAFLNEIVSKSVITLKGIKH